MGFPVNMDFLKIMSSGGVRCLVFETLSVVVRVSVGESVSQCRGGAAVLGSAPLDGMERLSRPSINHGVVSPLVLRQNPLPLPESVVAAPSGRYFLRLCSL